MKNTKHDITIQALTFFAENDYDRASLNKIAEAINVTKGAIYHYFKNKDELFEECLTFIINSLDSFFMGLIPENPTVKNIMDACLMYSDASEAMKELWNIEMDVDSVTFVNLLYTGLKKFPDMRDKYRESYTQLTTMLEGMILKEISEGVIKKDINPRLTALEIVTMSEGKMLMSSFFHNNDNQLLNSFSDELWSRIKV